MPRDLNKYEAIMQRDRQLAVHHGRVIPPLLPGFIDGPAGNRKKRPRSPGEWPHVARGVLVPDIFLPCNDAAAGGALVDMCNDIPFTANNGGSGAVAFQVARANWSGLFAGFGASPVAARGFRAAFERAWDPTMALFFVFLMQITATGGARTLFTLCGSVAIQMIGTGQLTMLIGGSTVATSAFDHRHATLAQEVAFLWDPTGPTPFWRISTSLADTITTTNYAVQGDTATGKGFGGTASPPDGVFGTAAGWLGSNALYMGDRSGPGQVTPGSRDGAALLVSELAA